MKPAGRTRSEPIPRWSPASSSVRGFTGRYVWHCHMLEHEDNEMMRPYEVIAAGT